MPSANCTLTICPSASPSISRTAAQNICTGSRTQLALYLNLDHSTRFASGENFVIPSAFFLARGACFSTAGPRRSQSKPSIPEFSQCLSAEQQIPFADHLELDTSLERQGIDRQPVLPQAEAQTKFAGSVRSRPRLANFRPIGHATCQQPNQRRLELEIPQQGNFGEIILAGRGRQHAILSSALHLPICQLTAAHGAVNAQGSPRPLLARRPRLHIHDDLEIFLR